jgi:hypothetical protein
MAKEKEVRFAVVTDVDGWKEQRGKQMHFKAVAAYAAKVITDPKNYQLSCFGPRWDVKVMIVEAGASFEIISLNSMGEVQYCPDFLDQTTWGPAHYIMTAMRNAVDSVKKINDEWITPTEVESRLNLKSGVVRKAIFDHKERLVGLECIKRADKRTWLVKWGWAVGWWGRHGMRVALDMQNYNVIFQDHWKIDPTIIEAIKKLEYTPSIITALAEYEDSRVVDICPGIRGQISRYIQNGEYCYCLKTVQDGDKFRDGDLYFNETGKTWMLFGDRIEDDFFGRKVMALGKLAICTE